MADPDTIDEAFGDESDELVDDLGGLNDGEMETLEEGLRPKRKRKRKRERRGSERGPFWRKNPSPSPAPSHHPPKAFGRRGGRAAEPVPAGKGAMSQKRL